MKRNDAEAIERAIDEYQRSQRKWLRECFSNEHVLLQLKRLNHDARSELVPHTLTESGAHAQFDQLVARGCDRRHMIDLLVLMDNNELPPRWLGLRNRT
ncbi:MAG TPA: hypothetical protein VHW00_10775, partial [Thermoanaerobaculia bacterium]|nr:hypothetical protein [Thermoanaerobaculia bacterium]